MRSRYTPHMSLVAKFVRQRTLDSVRAMSLAERIELAFKLGEHDISLYVAARASDRAAALAAFRAARQAGRRPSRAASDRRS